MVTAIEEKTTDVETDQGQEFDASKLSFPLRLVTAQYELKAPKSQRNDFGKYNYRSAEDILTAAKPINYKYGLLLILTDKPVIKDGWHYIKATATIYDCYSDRTFEAEGYARETPTKKGMDGSQITGTASSYARKYALNGLYLIDDTKDADTNEHHNQMNNTPNTEPKKINPTQVKTLKEHIKNLAELVTIKTGETITYDDMLKTILDKKLMMTMPIENLDTEQFTTIARYTSDLEATYKKK